MRDPRTGAGGDQAEEIPGPSPEPSEPAMKAAHQKKKLRSVELFAGAGGMALGLARAGFKHEAVVEWDAAACSTLRRNQQLPESAVRDWPIHHQDVRQFDYSHIPPDLDLLAAGVPCQPFSIAGKHRGPADERNMFPELVRAILHLRPKAVLLENVRGLTRPTFARYFGYIQLMVAYPEIGRRISEEWCEHSARLERHHTRGKRGGLFYRVVFRTLNAADYGIPQKRERVLIVAIRGDLGIEWSFPSPTHSQEALLWDQSVAGQYWERHRIAKKHRPCLRGIAQGKPNDCNDALFPIGPSRRPWKTVRDAFADLPAPQSTRAEAEPGLTHFEIRGARSYPGHTGSLLDQPAKTLKAGDHGVPGGENMVALPDGRVRYFTIRESARLQTFPDSHVFPGSWTESMRQIGNAVPVALGEILARQIRERL